MISFSVACTFPLLLTATPFQSTAPADAASGRETSGHLVQVGSRRTPTPEVENGFALKSWSISGPGVRFDLYNGKSEQEQIALADAYREEMRPIVAFAVERMSDGLGPAWLVEDSFGSVSLSGPDDAQHPGYELARTLMVALNSEFQETKRAKALPAGPERDQAQEQAKEAAARANDAMAQHRVQTTIVTLRAAEGDDVARALKLALPFATFASVGGNQIVASGRDPELVAAKELATQLDERAARQVAESMALNRERNTDSPAGRLLAQSLNVEFAGGAVNEYLKTIAKAAGAESWVIEDPRVGGAYIPTIKLTGVTADSAIKMLDGMVIQSADKAQPVSVPLFVMRVDPDAMGQGTPPIYRIGARFSSSKGSATAAPTHTQVFDVALTRYREDPDREARVKKAHDALLSAIETGISLSGPSPSFKVKLHPASGMLFANGTPEELGLVASIVDQWSSTQ